MGKDDLGCIIFVTPILGAIGFWLGANIGAMFIYFPLIALGTEELAIRLFAATSIIFMFLTPIVGGLAIYYDE